MATQKRIMPSSVRTVTRIAMVDGEAATRRRLPDANLAQARSEANARRRDVEQRMAENAALREELLDREGHR